MSEKKKNGTIIPILSVVLIICIIAIIIMCIHLFKKSDDKDYSSSGENTSASEIITEPSEELQKDTSSDSSSEDSEVIPEPVTLVSNEFFSKAYQKILSSKDYELSNYYNWQFEYEKLDYYPYYVAKEDNPCIAFSEITGDNIPELILVTVPEFNAMNAQIEFYTTDGDIAKNILTIPVDSTTGGYDYILFKNYKNELFLYTSVSAPSTVRKYEKIYMDDNGNLVYKAVCSEKITVNSKNSDSKRLFYVNGIETDEDSFSSALEKITGKGVNALIYNAAINEAEPDWITYASKESMVYSDAISYLTHKESVNDNELPFDETMDMEFTSGAGGWGTTISLNNDGTFEAYFYDSDMGDSGPGYANGTVYIGSCVGKFTNITKIDDYTYSMLLTDYEEKEIGDSYIEDETRFIPSETYGINSGEIIFCLPGKPCSEFSEEVLFWGYAMHSRIMQSKSLPCFMFYNTETGNAFYSY